jgi:hypothetical protein
MKVNIRAAVMALACLVAVLTLVNPANVQADPTPSWNPLIYKDHMRQAVLLCKRSIREIQSLPVDDSTPLDPQVYARAHESYNMIRVAWSGLALAQQKETSYKDPMLDLAIKKIEEALPLVRYPAEMGLLPRAEYINRSVQSLSRAVRLINQALVILP